MSPSAFRKLPIHPRHRGLGVVSLCDPGSGKVAFFVMAGHPFGLTASVFNYNRRGRFLTDFFVKDMAMLVLNFYDDRFGFTFADEAEEEAAAVTRICFLLGVALSDKTQVGRSLVVLGVTFDFMCSRIFVVPERLARLISEIEGIITSGERAPGQAGKLKGKLLFVSGHFKARHGRAYLRPLSEVQYATGGSRDLGPALRRALRCWLRILRTQSGTRSLFGTLDPAPPDAICFTDGSFPDPRPGACEADELPRIGWITFLQERAVGREEVWYSSKVVMREDMVDWEIRDTQISMIELMAPVIAFDALATKLRGRTVLLLIDSEPVQAALIKGFSSHEDHCDLVSVFWDICVEHDISVYICRVPTDANPSDGPSRGRFDEVEQMGAKWFEMNPSKHVINAAAWRRLQDFRCSSLLSTSAP